MTAVLAATPEPSEPTESAAFHALARRFMACPLPPVGLALAVAEDGCARYGESPSASAAASLSASSTSLALHAFQMRAAITHGSEAHWRERGLSPPERLKPLWFRLSLVFMLDRAAATRLFGPPTKPFASAEARRNGSALMRWHVGARDEDGRLTERGQDDLLFRLLPRLRNAFLAASWQPGWRELRRSLELDGVGGCDD